VGAPNGGPPKSQQRGAREGYESPRVARARLVGDGISGSRVPTGPVGRPAATGIASGCRSPTPGSRPTRSSPPTIRARRRARAVLARASSQARRPRPLGRRRRAPDHPRHRDPRGGRAPAQADRPRRQDPVAVVVGPRHSPTSTCAGGPVCAASTSSTPFASPCEGIVGRRSDRK
jgi:hypothetical protein